VSCATAWPALAQNVKITPLGSHAGELCDRDRALLFEDPTGLRLLYDAGRTVTGAGDSRLGAIHVVLLSHAHGDHIGDRRLVAENAGTCAQPETASAAPYGTTAEIVAAKNAAAMMVAGLGAFVARKVSQLRGSPTTDCADDIVPRAAPCVAGVALGDMRRFRLDGRPAVEITAVPAVHAHDVPLVLLTESERSRYEKGELDLPLGPTAGFVIRFTTGLTVYLTGDTAPHAAMQTIRDTHRPGLIVLNLGPTSLDPVAAAFVVAEHVRPAAVVVSHPNEAVTTEGLIRPGTRMQKFVALVPNRPVHLALSGRTMEFDAGAKCVAGCR